MKVSRSCGPILLIGFCAALQCTAFAQVTATIEASTYIRGFAETDKAIFDNGVRLADRDIEPYNNFIDRRDDNSDGMGHTVLIYDISVPANDSWNGDTPNASAFVDASAHAQMGDLGVALTGGVHEHTECCDFQGFADPLGTADIQQAQAFASWTDTISIHDSTLPMGAPLQLRTNWHLTKAGLSTEADGGGATIALFMYSAISAAGKSSEFNLSGSSVNNNPATQPPDTIPILYPVVNGVDNTLTVSLTLLAQAGASSSITAPGSTSFGASFDGDFSGSLHWGGIQDIEDASGHVLTGFTITSASGFDYTQPYSVPESATVCLAAQSLLLCGFRRARGNTK